MRYEAFENPAGILVRTVQLDDRFIGSVQAMARAVAAIRDNNGEFIVAASTPPVNEIVFLQAEFAPHRHVRWGRGPTEDNYHVEVRVEAPGAHPRMYRLVTPDFDIVERIFVEFYLSRTVANWSRWTDVTNEIL